MTGEELRRRAEALDWYHVLDLGQGVVTRGWFDVRPTRASVPLPPRLDGLRCLDVGTWDGFWAFELERRGAAEVVAVDLPDPEQWDWPPRQRLLHGRQGADVLAAFRRGDAGFSLAREALGSRVERRELSIYDLSPERVGSFDVVFVGSLLLHLRDPVRALDAVRSVCAGELVVADTIELLPTVTSPRTPRFRLDALDKPWWWLPNRAGLAQMVRSAGFEVVAASAPYFLPLGPAHPRASRRALAGMLRSAEGREQVVTQLRGIPHAAVRARPLR